MTEENKQVEIEDPQARSIFGYEPKAIAIGLQVLDAVRKLIAEKKPASSFEVALFGVTVKVTLEAKA